MLVSSSDVQNNRGAKPVIFQYVVDHPRVVQML